METVGLGLYFRGPSLVRGLTALLRFTRAPAASASKDSRSRSTPIAVGVGCAASHWRERTRLTGGHRHRLHRHLSLAGHPLDTKPDFTTE